MPYFNLAKLRKALKNKTLTATVEIMPLPQLEKLSKLMVKASTVSLISHIGSASCH
jgi:hypothetical protein